MLATSVVLVGICNSAVVDMDGSWRILRLGLLCYILNVVYSTCVQQSQGVEKILSPAHENVLSIIDVFLSFVSS